MIFKIMKSLLS